MTDIFILDLRKITGEITNKTPKCVIEMIAKYSNIVYDEKYLVLEKYLVQINNKLDEVSFPDSNDITKIDLFISSIKCNWDNEKRNIALKHLRSFYMDNPINNDNIPINFNYGNKTNEDPLKFNACILYRITKYYNIETKITTTIDVMAKSISFLLNGNIKNLKDDLIKTIKKLTATQIIELYNSGLIVTSTSPLIEASPCSFNNEIINCPRIEYNDENYKECQEYLFNISNLICRINPINHLEAICLTGIRYGIDISESINPIKQFYYISKFSFEGKTHINYTPKDDEIFSKKYITNPIYYNIKKHWCEKLTNIYDNPSLNKFIIQEGYSSTRLEYFKFPSNLLKEIRNKQNIYFGFNPYCKERKTLILNDNIETIDPNILLTIGIYNKPETLYYITLNELSDWFLDRKVFLNPVNLTIIEYEPLNKLKIRLNELLSQPKTFNIKIYQRCLDVIIELEEIAKSLSENAKEMSNYVRNINDDEKENIKGFWNLVIESGLYMRGWKINGDKHPLKSEDTNIEHSKQGEVEINTTIAISNIFERFKTLPDILKGYIQKLPIIKFNTNNKFISFFGEMINKKIYSDYDHKLLNVIENIKNTSNETSCLRTNSNWILISGIYYSEICGFKNNISIQDIRDIR